MLGRTADATMDRGRWRRPIRLGVTLGLALAALLVLPDALMAIPLELQLVLTHPLAALLGTAALMLALPTRPVGAAIARLRDRWRSIVLRTLPTRLVALAARCRPRLAARPPSRPARVVGRVVGWLLGRPLTVAAALACGVLLLTWVHHYLTWPWWIDTGQFAVSALAWEAGIRPYRDTPDFDFPGPIYLFVALGRAFGWGRTWPFYAADVALLLALGGALCAWSRRLFGRMSPGLLGFLLILGRYLGLDYTQVAQRDWQGPVLAVLAVMALQAWRGRGGRILSALAVGAAAAYRPHVILLLPAMLSAVDEGGRPPGAPWREALRPLAEWSAWCAAAVALAFGPLLAAGVLDDFVHVLGVTRYGGPYNRLTFFTFRERLGQQLLGGPTPWLLGATWALAVWGPEAMRRSARTWALAVLGVLLYKPISPVPHDYLDHPLALVRDLDAAWLLGWFLTSCPVWSVARLGVVTATAVLAVPWLPRYCSAERSLQAIGPLARGEDPELSPLGCASLLRDDPGGLHNWYDYRRLLAYLRHEAPKGVPVANVMRLLPFPAINGPIGRLTAFPAAGGLIHVALVDPLLEDDSAAALAASPGALVVWNPDDSIVHPKFRFPEVVRAIRTYYRPEVRFGPFQVWRHVASPGPRPSAPIARRAAPPARVAVAGPVAADGAGRGVAATRDGAAHWRP